MNTQFELIPQGVPEAEVAEFMALLAANGWMTRKQIAQRLGWNERKIRAVAEQAGTAVVRGQIGFKLVAQITAEDLPVVVQAWRGATSQAKKQMNYALGLRKAIHRVVGSAADAAFGNEVVE